MVMEMQEGKAKIIIRIYEGSWIFFFLNHEEQIFCHTKGFLSYTKVSSRYLFSIFTLLSIDKNECPPKIQHNYCRNPTKQPQIWCYESDGGWDFCDPLTRLDANDCRISLGTNMNYCDGKKQNSDFYLKNKCDESFSGSGRDYRGCQYKTRNKIFQIDTRIFQYNRYKKNTQTG